MHPAEQQGRDTKGGELENQRYDPPDNNIQQHDTGGQHGSEGNGESDDGAAQHDAGRNIATPHQFRFMKRCDPRVAENTESQQQQGRREVQQQDRKSLTDAAEDEAEITFDGRSWLYGGCSWRA